MADDELEAQILEQVEEWSSSSNECFTVDLLRGDGSTTASFQPDFTYPIFGEEEMIFGYQKLAIHLTFAAHNLQPHLAVSYGQKFKEVGEVRPTDIHEALRDFLPAVAFSRDSAKEALRDEQAAAFTPPGEKVHQYARDGQKFEVWCASLADPAAKQLLENMQVLVPMFIEGGTMLQLDYDWTTARWKLFLLYQVASKSTSSQTFSPYSLVGYGTSYRTFTFPDRSNPTQIDHDLFANDTQSILDCLPPPETTIPNDYAPTAMPNNIISPLDLPSRERLSQFLILPPFHKAGHGQEHYNTMYSALTTPLNIREFTVEDPNEAFDDLRDLCDLLRLRAQVPAFAALRVNPNIPADKLDSNTAIPTDLIVPTTEAREQIMRDTKIMPRQFDRLVEMHTLSFIPPNHRSRSRITRKDKASNDMDKAYYLWRLYVKQRLYIFNRDQMTQMDREERVEKLESALDSVLEAYAKMIEKVEARERSGKTNGDANGGDEAVEGAATTTPTKNRRKRKIIEDDDDEEDSDEVESPELVVVNGKKKPRVE